jgi:hypothetical protein
MKLLLWLLAGMPVISMAQLVNNGASMTMTSGTHLGINNLSFKNDGVFDQAVGTVSFTGAAAASISGAVIPAFYILNLNKPGTNLQLQTSIHVNNNLQMVNGSLNLNANNIFLDPAALLNGESETSYITGTNGGYVQIMNVLNAPSAANPGNLGAVITSSNNLGTVTIRRGHRSQHNTYGGGSSLLRYYDIIPDNNTALNASLRINYLDAELNNLDENGFTMTSSSDNQHWTNMGFSARTATGNYVEQTGINSFSRFTLTEVANPLPLIWGSFNTQCVTSQVRIAWKTFQEQNTATFIVRRSANGSTWTDIGTVPAVGNSQSALSYSFTDGQPLAGASYYQIQQKDADGRQALSPILTNRCGQPESINVYPNPVQSDCVVSIQSDEGHMATMRLYNSLGALLQQQTVSIQAGNNQFVLKMHAYMPGIYSLVITRSDGKRKAIRLEKYFNRN